MNPHNDSMRRLVNGPGLSSLGLVTAQLVAPGVMNRLIGADTDAKTRAVQRWLGGAREVTLGTATIATAAVVGGDRGRPGLPRWA
ncbi:MAG: hypothetical protein M3186_17970 [Actinomycetota bacterium]|nr:hypothetical protein [Actinomycetota bacterium]